MTFTTKTTSEIVNDIIITIVNDVPDVTDINPGSALRSMVEAMSLELSTLYSELQNIYDGTRINTSTGTDLENLGALVGITRKTGTQSTGYVTFSRLQPAVSDFTIPSGSIISTQPNTGEEQLRFTVDANTTFSASITGETNTFIDGFFNQKLNERFISSISSLTGLVSTAPFTFTQGTDFQIVNDFSGVIIDPSTFVLADDCDVTTGWSGSADATAIAVNAVDFKQGVASLDLGKSGVTTNDAYYEKTLSAPINVENLFLFNWIKIIDATALAKIDHIEISFGSGGTINDSFTINILSSNLTTGWNQYLVNPFDPSVVQIGFPNSTIINYIRINIVTNNIIDTLTSGDVIMDMWGFASYENYEGDIIQWIETGTRPDNGSIWTIDYIPLSKEVLCSSEFVGSKYNVGRHKIIFKVSNISNINNVENYVQMEGGVDLETDDELRERIKLASEVAGNATVLALQQAVLGVNGVTSVTVDDTPTKTRGDEPLIYDSGIDTYKLDFEVATDNANFVISNSIGGSADYVKGVDYVILDSQVIWQSGGTTPVNGATFYVTYEYEWLGHVFIFVAGSVTPLQTSVINNIQTAIDDTRAAGVEVSFAEPTAIVINVAATITIDTATGLSFADVSNNVESALRTYLNTLPVGEDVYLAELYRVIQEVTGVENSTITAPATDTTIAINEVGRAGTIIIT